MIQPSLNLSGHHTPSRLYMDHAGFKVPSTSQEAAEAVSPTIKQAHEALMKLLKGYSGLTADEAGQLLGWTPFYARPRMSELHGRLLVKKIGRAVNSSGKAANVWGLA